MNGRVVRLSAFAGLAVLAAVLTLNLIAATGRYVDAFQAYDELELALTEFNYTAPDAPIATTFQVTNPTDRAITITAIELRINAGARRVGGGEHRPLRTDPVPGLLAPGATAAWSVPLNINEPNFISQLPRDDIDWRVSGRIEVRVDDEINPQWIPFTVAFLPEPS